VFRRGAALENTSMSARHEQTEAKRSARRSPSKKNSVKKREKKERGQTNRVCDDIRVTINLYARDIKYFSIEKEKR